MSHDLDKESGEHHRGASAAEILVPVLVIVAAVVAVVLSLWCLL